jgi:hypothetical protein
VSTLAILIALFVVLVIVLIAGGLIITGRRAREEDPELRVALREADQALALAQADDRGWHREALEAAARDAFADRSPAEVRELMLVQVVDRPGTDEDRAVFRVITDAGSEDIELERHGDRWIPAGA